MPRRARNGVKKIRKKAPVKKYNGRRRQRRAKYSYKAISPNQTGIVQSAGEVGRGIGSIFGPLGTVVGGGLGHLVGEGIKYFTGRGDYEVRNNVLMEEIKGMPPIINKTGPGTTYRRCEYITDIISGPAGSFNLQNFFVNPGLQSTFQWLSQVAGNYEEYEIEGLYFEFRTMSADALNSTNTALGQVIMAADYNAAHPNFANKMEMENYEGGISCKPSQNMRYFLECQRSQTVLNDLYIRTGSIPPNEDQRFYDIANFQIATNGLQASNINLGELWVCYQISLRKPRLFGALGFDNSFFFSQNTGGAGATPLGTAFEVNASSNIAIVQTSTVLTFPFSSLPQAYILTINWVSSGVVFTPPILTGSIGVTLAAMATSPQAGVAGVFSETMVQSVAILANNLVSTITFGVAGTVSAPNVQVLIVQVPNSFLGL